jgi:Flp pilus assembly protein TadB
MSERRLRLWSNVEVILLDILNPNKNGLREAPPEFKFMISCVLAAFWCIAFGIYTAELLFIGYSIIGHIILIFMVFVTWKVFSNVRENSEPSPPNKVKWNLESEG